MIRAIGGDDLNYKLALITNMKKIYLLSLSLLCFIIIGFTQQKPIAKAVIQTPTVQCEACKDRIEKHLFREYGMSSAKADYRKHIVTVTYYRDRTNIENIKTSLANLGFDADDVTADDVTADDALKNYPKPANI